VPVRKNMLTNLEVLKFLKEIPLAVAEKTKSDEVLALNLTSSLFLLTFMRPISLRFAASATPASQSIKDCIEKVAHG
jgi:hypothetical protein